jgi:hypothetical protein
MLKIFNSHHRFALIDGTLSPADSASVNRSAAITLKTLINGDLLRKKSDNCVVKNASGTVSSY